MESIWKEVMVTYWRYRREKYSEVYNFLKRPADASGCMNLILLHSNHGRGMKHVGGRGEAYTGFWWRNLMERDHLEDSGVVGRIILRWVFRKWDVGAWTGSIWLRIRTGDWHL